MTRRIPAIVIAAAVLLTAAFWFLLYQPKREEQARYRSEAAQLETERGDLQAEIAALREIEENAEDYRARLVRVRDFIPSDPAQPQALQELQRAADDSGVEITELVFADPEAVVGAPETNDPETTLARIPTQMTVTGGYFQVVDLLRRIEVDLARAIKIETVTMAEDEEQTFPDLTVTWTGSVFAVLPLTDAFGPDGAPVEIETSSEAPSEGASEGATEPAAPDTPEGADGQPQDAARDTTTNAGTS